MGKKITQKVAVSNVTDKATVKLSYKSNVNAGTVTIIISGTENYTGTIVETFKIAKAAQKMKVKAANKSVKYTAVKKKAQTVKKTVVVTNSKGKISFARVAKGSSKYLTISKSGVITVKKKTKRVLILAKSRSLQRKQPL